MKIVILSVLVLLVATARTHFSTFQGDVMSASPTVTQILDNYELAIGGREAWNRLSTEHETATIDYLPSGATGTYEEYDAAPALFSGIMILPNHDVSKVGFDGSVAWTTNSRTGRHFS